MKIDITNIAGYADMTAEEKIKALENFEYEIPIDESGKLKNLLNKANSEAAEYKKALREKLSEQERLEAERAEADKALREELASLKRDKAVSQFKAQFLESGYNAELAQSSAEAMANGDATTVFANLKQFNEAFRASVEAEMLKKQPNLSSGGVPSGTPDYNNMTDEEYYASQNLIK